MALGGAPAPVKKGQGLFAADEAAEAAGVLPGTGVDIAAVDVVAAGGASQVGASVVTVQVAFRGPRGGVVRGSVKGCGSWLVEGCGCCCCLTGGAKPEGPMRGEGTESCRGFHTFREEGAGVSSWVNR